ncbi:hypothetical protein CTI12_AA378230 [Artemisia annua]|nr:hypothetical protein CTI12_AA378230 [Artemisia annua]
MAEKSDHLNLKGYDDNEQDEFWNFFAYQGFVWMGYAAVIGLYLFGLYLFYAVNFFEDDPLTIESLAVLNGLGFICFYFAYRWRLRDLPLRIFASVGLCTQLSMIVIFFAHFMRHGPDTMVGLFPLVLLGPYLYQEIINRLLARLFGTVEGEPK